MELNKNNILIFNIKVTLYNKVPLVSVNVAY